MERGGTVGVVGTDSDDQDASADIGQRGQIISKIVDVVELPFEVKMTGLYGALTDQAPDAGESVSVGRDAQPGEEGVHGHQDIRAELRAYLIGPALESPVRAEPERASAEKLCYPALGRSVVRPPVSICASVGSGGDGTGCL